MRKLSKSITDDKIISNWFDKSSNDSLPLRQSLIEACRSK